MRTKRVVAIANVVALLLVSVALTSPGGRVSAAGDAAGSSASAIAASGSYADYRAANEAADSPDADIEVNLQTGSADEALKTSMTQTEEGEALQLSGEAGAVTFTFNVPEEGNYALYVEYQPLDTVGEIGLSLRLDDALPFQEAGSLSLERPYQLDGSEFETDEYGNQLSIDKSVAQEWFSRYLTDTSGSYGEPYRFFLTAGTHSVTLDFSKAGLLLRKLSFCQTEEPNPYQAPDSSLNSSGQFQSIQAELPYRTSDSTLTADTDRTDAATYPNEPGVSLLNTIGGSSWTQQGQWISWKFNITEPGVYYIALRARQNIRSGLFSTRKVYIDGEVPFEELNEVKFPNRLGWYNKVLGDDIPYGFYFDAGEHEIRIEVTPGIYADAMQALSEATAILNDYYRRIIMITGTDPDTYQDYALEENIPTMLEDFAALRDILLEQKDYLERESGLKGSETATLTTMATQLDSFVKDPGSIPDRLSAFRESISSLSAWYLELGGQPLELDQIYVYSPNVELPKASAGFFSNLVFSLRAIIASFFTDYSTVDFNQGNQAGELKVWINTGRDQLQILNRLIADGFQKQTGAKVSLNISAASGSELPIQNGLLETLMAGRGPDVCLFAPPSNPVDMAVRNALIPLNEFEGFDEVAGRFNEQAMVPYCFQGKAYALPVTQVFNVLYYRADILEELGLEVPKTWDDLYRIIPVIQSKNLEVGVPSDVSTFQSMLYQAGVGVYTDDLTKTTFDTQEALDAFQQWTSLYANYSFDLTFDFFNRFRTGEMPIGIASFTTYTQLLASAPEITGLWDVALMPGTLREDGTVDHAVIASGSTGASATGSSCAFITKDTKDAELAWKFLKWFTSEEVQYEYGIQLELALGPTGRYTTANLAAFERLPWESSVKDVLFEQRGFLREVPQIPGSYYVSRDINNALRQVVLNGENPRQILNYYNQNINKELARKRQELRLDQK